MKDAPGRAAVPASFHGMPAAACQRNTKRIPKQAGQATALRDPDGSANENDFRKHRSRVSALNGINLMDQQSGFRKHRSRASALNGVLL